MLIKQLKIALYCEDTTLGIFIWETSCYFKSVLDVLARKGACLVDFIIGLNQFIMKLQRLLKINNHLKNYH